MLLKPLFTHARNHRRKLAMTDRLWPVELFSRSKHVADWACTSRAKLKNRTSHSPAPSAGFAASFYGTLLAGKSIVPINYLLGDRELHM